MTTLGGLLDLCREVTGSDAEWVPVPEEELLAAGVEPWVHLPLWLPAETARHRLGRRHHRAPASWGCRSRPLAESVADTWAWQQANERPPLPPGAHRREPGLPPGARGRQLPRHGRPRQ